MYKSIVSLAFLVGILSQSVAQVVDYGEPISWSGKVPAIRSYYTLPAIDAAEQIRIDSLNRANGFTKMYRFGYEHQLEIDLFEQGTMVYTPSGDRITRFAIECPTAFSVNVIFDRFEMAEGARLDFYSEDRTQRIGSYAAHNNNVNEMLGTEIIKSDRVVLEVFEPAAVIGETTLMLGTIVHGYRDLDAMLKGLNDSGACNIDVNCPKGAGWENQRNSVGMMISGGGFCTGSLVNNTSGEIIPYFLTADHCGNTPGSWSYRFRWETPENQVSCATTANSGNGPTNMFVSGGVLRANNNNSDFLLIELNAAPDPAWGIYYNGWDASDAMTATRTTGIHHPRGDVKKICHSEMAPTKQVIWGGNNTWRVNNWTEGVTEPASSGSPLFDQNGRVIGVLSGGGAACSGTVNNGLEDSYGRIGVAWATRPEANNQLKHWLDPGNTGVTILDGLDPLIGASDYDVALTSVSGISSFICNEDIAPLAVIRNLGNETLTSATIRYTINDGDEQVINWTGNLEQLGSEEVQLTEFTPLPGQNTIIVSVDEPNGEEDENPNNNSITRNFMSSGPNPALYSMELTFDCYANETTWNIADEEGVVWYSGGSYTSNFNNQETINPEFCLTRDCYNLTINDSWGDGINGSVETNCNFDGEMYFYDEEGNVLAEISTSEGNVNFGATFTAEFCGDELSTEVWIESINQISVYPNPSNGVFTIDFGTNEGVKSVILMDMTGKVLKTIKSQDTQLNLNESSLATGVYILRIQLNDLVTTRKVVVE